MASKFTILPATETDLPILARIAIIAMEADILHRVMFPSNDPLNTTFKESFVLTNLKMSFGKPGTWFLKAMDKEVGEITGYAILVFCEKGENDQENERKGEGPLPEGINLECRREISVFMRNQKNKYFAEKRYAWWSHLMVLPSFQGQGIGKALLNHGFYNLGADDVINGLSTHVKAKGMYEKSGFEVREYLDVDMARFMGENRGFGVHRNYFMVRLPGGENMFARDVKMESE